MKFRATVAIFLPFPCPFRHPPLLVPPPRTTVSFRFANKIHSTAGGAIEKARRSNTVKATIIGGDIENFSSLTAMHTETELYNISCAPPSLSLSPFFSLSLCHRCLSFLSYAFENVSRRPINHQFERLYESAQKIFPGYILKHSNEQIRNGCILLLRGINLYKLRETRLKWCVDLIKYRYSKKNVFHCFIRLFARSFRENRTRDEAHAKNLLKDLRITFPSR